MQTVVYGQCQCLKIYLMTWILTVLRTSVCSQATLQQPYTAWMHLQLEECAV